jgi:hypothetical protein
MARKVYGICKIFCSPKFNSNAEFAFFSRAQLSNKLIKAQKGYIGCLMEEVDSKQYEGLQFRGKTVPKPTIFIVT